MLLNETAPAIYFLFAALFEHHAPLLLSATEKYFLF